MGEEKNQTKSIKNSNINILKIINDTKKLIEIYDNHSILVLPSFTEGHPMVLLESLSRYRPVIIFPEIKHIIGEKKEYLFLKEIIQV